MAYGGEEATQEASNAICQRPGQAAAQAITPNQATIDQQHNVTGDQRHAGRDLVNVNGGTVNIYQHGIPGTCLIMVYKLEMCCTFVVNNKCRI